MRRTSTFASLLVSMVALACSSTGTPQAKPDAEPGAIVESPGASPAPSPEREAAGDAPAATRGCRAPDEVGCNPCCEAATEPGFCHQRAWAGGANSTVAPWYNKVSRLAGACPSDCSPCADCSKRAEQEFRRLVARPDCDCSQPPGVDPCFRPDSCGCHCLRFGELSAACPHLRLPGAATL